MCVTNEKKGDVHCTCIRENKSYWLDVVAEHFYFFPFLCVVIFNETKQKNAKQNRKKENPKKETTLKCST